MKCIAFLFFFISNLYSAKLDISASNDFYIKSFKNLIYQDYNYNLSYYQQQTSLSFTLKNITLEKTEDSFMDVSIGINAVSIDGSSKTINSPYLNELYEYNQNNSFYLYSNRAYIRIYNFIDDNIIATFGKQPYTLSSGLVLSGNSKGLDGVRIELLNRLYLDSIELFYFRTNNFFSPDNISDDIYGSLLNKSFGDGLWQVYFLKNQNSQTSRDVSFTSNKVRKNFYGISYNINKENIYYQCELAFQNGFSNDITNNKINHNAYALNVTAGWKTYINKLGNLDTRFNYLKASGNNSPVSYRNKAFFSPYSKRFDGYQRDGYGEIYKASVSDAIKTTDTLTGFSSYSSGIRVISFGFDIPKKRSIISIDYFNYEVDKSLYSTNKSLGSEFNIKYTIKMGEKADFYLLYGTFSPHSIIDKNSNLKTTKLFSINIKTRF